MIPVSTRVSSIEMERHFNIQLSKVEVGFLDGDRALQDFSLLDIQVKVSVEDDLFPMSSLGVGASAEVDLIREFIEVDIEPSHDSMDSVISKESEFISRREVELFFSYSVKINIHNFAFRGVDGSALTDVNKRFRHDGGFDTLHVDSVLVVPESEFVLFIVAILHSSNGDAGFIRENLIKSRYFNLLTYPFPSFLSHLSLA